MSEILAVLLEQEELLQCNRFDSEMAWRLGSYVVSKARKEMLPIAVDISLAGCCLFHWSANNAVADNDRWIERKSRSVMRFGHSSYFLGQRLASEQKSAIEKHFVSETEYAFHGGCFPIRLRDTGVIGTITVSGLKQEDDHALVVEALAYILRKQQMVPHLK